MTFDSKTVAPSARTSAGTFRSGLTAANSAVWRSAYVTTRVSIADVMPLSRSHSRTRAALLLWTMSKKTGFAALECDRDAARGARAREITLLILAKAPRDPDPKPSEPNCRETPRVGARRR